MPVQEALHSVVPPGSLRSSIAGPKRALDAGVVGKGGDRTTSMRTRVGTKEDLSITR